MNATLEKAIIERLHTLDDVLLAEVFDFVDFLQRRKVQAATPLTGLFSQENAAMDDSNRIVETLGELRLERAKSLENTLALVESVAQGQHL